MRVTMKAPHARVGGVRRAARLGPAGPARRGSPCRAGSGGGRGGGGGGERQQQQGGVGYQRDTFKRARAPDSFDSGDPYFEGGGGGGGGASTSSNTWWGEEMGGVTKALLAGSFVFGIAFGAWLNGEANFQPNNVASTEIVDRRTPSGAVCMANGYSSMVFDQRIFVSFNPFNVYVTSPEVKPGCVLRQANVQELEKRKLVTRSEADVCRKGMNTFAYVGSLDEKPEVSCVYHSEEAENQFMLDPRRSNLGDGNRLTPQEAVGSQPAFAE